MHTIKVAVLVANGFLETDYIMMQRAFQAQGAKVSMISVETALTNSWRGSEWGLHFSADAQLSTALAADFDALIIPGGQRAMDKLQMTAHTARFLNGFLNAGKPVMMMNDATQLMSYIERPAIAFEDGQDFVTMGHVFAMRTEGHQDEMIVKEVMGFMASCPDMSKAA